MKEKLKNFISTTKGKVALASTTLTTTLLWGQNAFAAGEVPDISGSITTGLTGMANQFVSIVTAVAPIGLTMFGAVFLWKKSVKFFRGMA